jgi:hypothetical protein
MKSRASNHTAPLDTPGRSRIHSNDRMPRNFRQGSSFPDCRPDLPSCRSKRGHPAAVQTSWMTCDLTGSLGRNLCRRTGRISAPSPGNQQNPTPLARARETCVSSFPPNTTTGRHSTPRRDGCAQWAGRYNLYRRHNRQNPRIRASCLSVGRQAEPRPKTRLHPDFPNDSASPPTQIPFVKAADSIAPCRPLRSAATLLKPATTHPSSRKRR